MYICIYVGLGSKVELKGPPPPRPTLFSQYMENGWVVVVERWMDGWMDRMDGKGGGLGLGRDLLWCRRGDLLICSAWFL